MYTAMLTSDSVANTDSDTLVVGSLRLKKNSGFLRNVQDPNSLVPLVRAIYQKFAGTGVSRAAIEAILNDDDQGERLYALTINREIPNPEDICKVNPKNPESFDVFYGPNLERYIFKAWAPLGDDFPWPQPKEPPPGHNILLEIEPTASQRAIGCLCLSSRHNALSTRCCIDTVEHFKGKPKISAGKLYLYDADGALNKTVRTTSTESGPRRKISLIRYIES